MPEFLPLGKLQEPHRWHTFSAIPFAEFARALRHVAGLPDGQTVLAHLIVTYLLAHPANDRDVGKQDLIRELLDVLQQAMLTEE